ncbi:hypothetical protein [Streptomyces sp. NPDC051132]
MVASLAELNVGIEQWGWADERRRIDSEAWFAQPSGLAATADRLWCRCG